MKSIVYPDEKLAMQDLVELVRGANHSPQGGEEDLQSRRERFRRLDGEQVLKLLIMGKAAGIIIFMA
jgi:hypothetical protein